MSTADLGILMFAGLVAVLLTAVWLAIKVFRKQGRGLKDKNDIYPMW